MYEHKLAEIKRKIEKCKFEIELTKEKIEKNLSDLSEKSPTIYRLITGGLEYKAGDMTSQRPKAECNGRNFYEIEPPKASIDFLVEFLAYNKIYQKGLSKNGNRCLQFADAYGRWLYYNDVEISGRQKGVPLSERKIMDIENFVSSSSTFWNDEYFIIPSDKINDIKYRENVEKEIIELMYNEYQDNKPCVLQVNQVQSDNNIGRHYVTVIGLSEDANPNNLKDTDFEIIDPGDGERKVLGEKGDGTYARHIHMDYGPITPDGQSVYYYRVQTLIDENERLEKLNARRKKMGLNPLTGFPEEEG